MKPHDEASIIPRLALRAREAAVALGISERLLWQWTQEGIIPHVRRGGILCYPVDSLRQWLSEQVEQTKASDDNEAA